MNVPDDLLYTEEHEWIQIEEDSATIGITDYAQQELGDVVYVELPEEGLELETGQAFGSVESVKAVSEIFAPCPVLLRNRIQHWMIRPKRLTKILMEMAG